MKKYSKIEWQVIKKYKNILFNFYNGIAKITINRPHVCNAFNVDTVDEILDALLYCKQQLTIDVIIITGVGKKYFCSGGDQKTRIKGGYLGSDGLAHLNILELYKNIKEIPKVVIAMVNGYAVGGGNVLQVVCDLTIASNNSFFAQVGPKVGSFDGGVGSSLLSRHIGHKKAKEMWFLCEKYSAYEALKMGLINKVVDLHILEHETVAISQKIQRRSPFAIRMIKRSFNADLDGHHGLMQFSGDATLLFYLTKESQEGKKAFLEKRKPNFKKFKKYL